MYIIMVIKIYQYENVKTPKQYYLVYETDYSLCFNLNMDLIFIFSFLKKKIFI